MTHTDLLVVGAGTAGLNAAVEAARLGLRVTLLEGSERVGGTLWRSWAQLSAAGTDLQRRKGIADSAQEHFDDVLRISHGTADPVLVRLAVEHAADTVDGLEADGFDMDPDAPALFHFHEPYRVPRTYWGRDAGRSVLAVLVPALERAVAAGDVDLRLGTAVEELLVDGDRVRGVLARTGDGAAHEVLADSVLLTAGGYAGSPERFREWTQGAPLVGPGAPTSTGAVIAAALRAGARLRGQDLFLPTYGGVLRAGSDHEAVGLDDFPQLTPQSRPPWEIHVNLRGERFVAEDGPSVDVREHALLDQPGLEFWVVFDQHVVDHAPPLLPTWSAEQLEEAYRANASFVRADDLAGLARATGVDEAGLVATVEEYAAAVRTGTDRLGRTHLPHALGTAPWYAIRNHGTTLKSPAGLAVGADLRVLRDGGCFENLYAAGEVIGGSTLSGRSFVSGMSVTPALSFARLVARTVAGLSLDPGSR